MSDLTLYALVSTPGSTPQFSPHVWKTKIDFAVLGMDYKEVGLTFTQIRNDLAAKTHNDAVTVPTLELSSGEFLTDSWAIAEWLEENHAKPRGRTLFGADVHGRAFAKFMETYANTVLAKEVRPLIMGKVYQNIDPPSKTHFSDVKLAGDTALLQTYLSNLSSPDAIASHVASAKFALKPIEELLAFHHDNHGWKYLSGETPGHADACVFGWYAFCRLNKDLMPVWEGGKVGEWIEEMIGSGLVKREELL